jgi:hypothetical protein
VSWLALAFLLGQTTGPRTPEPARDAELARLMPFLIEACEPVREDPALFPYRAFPYGPLGLDVRKASGPGDANDLVNFHTGVMAAACGLRENVTAHFHCAGCPEHRARNLRGQLASIKEIKRLFDPLGSVAVLSIWDPVGELRVNDVFVMKGTAREAIPSQAMGFVPSGDWKPWPGLPQYLSSIRVSEDSIKGIVERMRRAGLTAIVRKRDGTRFVGVGIGDNESGILFLHAGSPPPPLRVPGTDGRELVKLEKLENGVYYYETS